MNPITVYDIIQAGHQICISWLPIAVLIVQVMVVFLMAKRFYIFVRDVMVGHDYTTKPKNEEKRKHRPVLEKPKRGHMRLTMGDDGEIVLPDNDGDLSLEELLEIQEDES